MNDTLPSSSPTTSRGLEVLRVAGTNVVVSGGAYVRSESLLGNPTMSPEDDDLKVRKKTLDRSVARMLRLPPRRRCL